LSGVTNPAALFLALLLILGSLPVASASTGVLTTTPQYVAPQDIANAYNVTSLIESGFTGKSVTVAVVNVGIDGTFFGDVQGFDQTYGLPNASVSVVRPYGSEGTDSELPAGETTADVEFVHAMAPDAHILVVLVGTESLLNGFSYVIDNDAANIATVSPSWAYWGQGAKDLVNSYNSEYAKSVDRNITLIAASNDWGSNNTVPWGTISGDFWTLHLPDSYLMPQYSPYVTAVGGTALTLSAGRYSSEVGWNQSGGGPSNLFPQPQWQKGLGVPNNGYRDIPDVALDASCTTPYLFYWQSRVRYFCGTSAAAPTLAGIVADIIQAAGHPVGFLNPLLYSIASSDPSAFHDITSGCSVVRIGSAVQTGYCASRGWDYVTGLGSPDAIKLLKHLAPAAELLSTSTTSSTVPELPEGSVPIVVFLAIALVAVLTRGKTVRPSERARFHKTA
jgi:subtilase family serine protease